MKTTGVIFGLSLLVTMSIACGWWWGREYESTVSPGIYVDRATADPNVREVVQLGYKEWRAYTESRLLALEDETLYDPNDPAYKYIPEADPTWIEKFGASERTRLLHSISELRFVVAAQGKRLVELENWQEVQPPLIYSEEHGNRLWGLYDPSTDNTVNILSIPKADPNEVSE
jgi:hypothetical protein